MFVSQRYVVLFFFTTLGALYGCKGNEGYPIYHPTAENIPDTSLATTQIASAAFDHLDDNEVQAYLHDFKPELTFGREYGDDYEVFGNISDVKIDASGVIYYLDRNRQNITIFDPDLSTTQIAGQKGAGPGDLESAKSISLYEDWLIIDNNYRMEVFNILENNVEYLKSVELNRPASSSCVIGDVLYTTSPISLQDVTKEDPELHFAMIHAYSLPEFKHLFSFGESYQSDNLPLVSVLSRGEISCNPFSSTIVFKFERLPFLYGYSAESGELKWSLVFEEIQMPRIEEGLDNGMFSVGFNPVDNTWQDNILRTVTVLNEYSLVQIDRRFLANTRGQFLTENKNETHSFILNTETGQSSYISQELPRILGISDRLFVAVNSDYVISTIYRKSSSATE